MVQQTQIYAFGARIDFFAYVAIAYKVTKLPSILSITGQSGLMEPPWSLEGGLQKLTK